MMEETLNVKVIEIDVDTDIEPPTAVKLYDVYQSIVSTITILSRDLRDKNAAMEKAVAKVDELTAQKDKVIFFWSHEQEWTI